MESTLGLGFELKEGSLERSAKRREFSEGGKTLTINSA
jgi:hypothetical protein